MGHSEKDKKASLGLPEKISASVALRGIVVANALMIVGAALKMDPSNPQSALDFFVGAASYGELAILATLAILGSFWEKMGERGKIALTIGAGGAATILSHLLLSTGPVPMAHAAHSGIFGSLVAGIVLGYFDWRHKTLSPALSEARLQALQSRIRPHFFFNAINGIAMLASKNAELAEEALLDLADVFRALMREQAAIGTVRSEIDLTRKYLSIEKMRFGDRLRLSISAEDKALGAELPSLLIQPLAENAIIHGIEPVGEGEVSIRVFVKESHLHIVLENPFVDKKSRAPSERKGNHMALENIRQRLALLYPDEASFSAQGKGGIWRSHVKLPLRFPERAGARQKPQAGSGRKR